MRESSLPNETLALILADLPPAVLAIVARVSHRFNAVSERILYTSATIIDLLSLSSPYPVRTLQWCEAMDKRVHLHEITRRVSIRWQVESREPYTYPQPHPYLPHPALPTFAIQLGRTLHHLTLLESLDLFLGPANNSPERVHVIEHVIPALRFTHLQHCSLGADWSKFTTPYSPLLSAFLLTHPSLRHLNFPDYYPHHHHNHYQQQSPLLAPNALPNLSSFRGFADAAALFLPGRPVHYLSLLGSDSDVTDDILAHITLTSIPLRFLDLSAMFVRPRLLRILATRLPTIHSLRVRLALRHTLHYSMSGIRILTGLSPVLSSFTHLSWLDLSPTDISSHYASPATTGARRPDTDQDEVEHSLCREWARVCPALRRVTFPSRNEWTNDDHGGWFVDT
ncbi:hypothetical protein AMATHDRAFT_59955 [Amanita thiersii Skay4041]|uniref:F-box domain-containing protein n=1 Tax=Amanita thiersii Skay4041 TaxID=703135 RepID=A0A2A9NRS4_9AGAR|nr:hypothetical protein AMATHDRAFT_59955 [Amanita thiersii Skay4041]